nr:unnamed protein product [Callosobruchus analis]
MAKQIVKEIIHEKDFIDLLVGKLVTKVCDKVYEKVEELTIQINAIEKKVGSIQEDQEDIHVKLEELEQSSKLNQLRVYGIPECSSDLLKCKLQDVFKNNLGIQDNIDISRCYRVGTPRDDKCRAVVVFFDSWSQRNVVYFNKKKLKGTKISITEELIKSKYQLLQYARDKLSYKMVWTVDGRIFTKVNGRKFLIKNEEDVLKITT